MQSLACVLCLSYFMQEDDLHKKNIGLFRENALLTQFQRIRDEITTEYNAISDDLRGEVILAALNAEFEHQIRYLFYTAGQVELDDTPLHVLFREGCYRFDESRHYVKRYLLKSNAQGVSPIDLLMQAYTQDKLLINVIDNNQAGSDPKAILYHLLFILNSPVPASVQQQIATKGGKELIRAHVFDSDYYLTDVRNFEQLETLYREISTDLSLPLCLKKILAVNILQKIVPILPHDDFDRLRSALTLPDNELQRVDDHDKQDTMTHSENAQYSKKRVNEKRHWRRKAIHISSPLFIMRPSGDENDSNAATTTVGFTPGFGSRQ